MYPDATGSSIDALALRRVMGRREWGPPEPKGPDGWRLTHTGGDGSVIVTCAMIDRVEWIHASMTRRGRVPSYDDLRLLHRAAFGDGWAYQLFAPAADHVNIHPYALHIWGRLDGRPAMIDFVAKFEEQFGVRSI